MRVLTVGLFLFLVALSVATGLTKLIRLPAEMDLFRNAGFSEGGTLLFGGVQVLGGLLLILPATRKIGAIGMMLTFAVASWVVWRSGMAGFLALSIGFILLATLPLWPGVRLPDWRGGRKD